MKPDDQFRQWWVECLGKPALKPNEIIPIRHALQGHPESPMLWMKYIDKMLIEEMKFKACNTHEPCLYYRFDDNDDITVILRQVDDFLVCNKDATQCDAIGKAIQDRMTFPLNELRTVKRFNGIDIKQTRNFKSYKL